MYRTNRCIFPTILFSLAGPPLPLIGPAAATSSSLIGRRLLRFAKAEVITCSVLQLRVNREACIN